MALPKNTNERHSLGILYAGPLKAVFLVLIQPDLKQCKALIQQTVAQDRRGGGVLVSLQSMC